VQQRTQQFAVVELAFLWQVEALGKSVAQRGFQSRQGGAIEPLEAGQLGHGPHGVGQLPVKALGLGSILSVPQHQRAFLLKVDRSTKSCNQLRPARDGMATHANHAGLGHRRFSQWSQHRRGCAR
jgi:hypothetical protein